MVHQQHIPDVAGILKDRPGMRLRPGAHIGDGVPERFRKLADAWNDPAAS
jgi:hypothetical protein